MLFWIANIKMSLERISKFVSIWICKKLALTNPHKIIEGKRRTKMKNFKKICATGFAALISISSLTGCMNKPTTNTNNNSGSGRVEPPSDIWAPYEETVTVTTMGEENSGTEFQGDDDYGNNPWYRAYKERFNIDLQNKWISNDYSTKLNLAIADKDIADVFYVDSARLTTLHDADLIMPLDEVFETYASDVLKQYRKDYADTWKTGEFDGQLYGMPQMSYGIIDQFQYIYGFVKTG